MTPGFSKLFVMLLTGACLIFTAPPAEAFVPIPSHLAQLVVEKIKRPTGLEAIQTIRVYSDASEDAGGSESKERLMYLFPDRLRCETVSSDSGGSRTVAVVSDDRFVKTVDGKLESTTRSVTDYYTDILLFRDRKLLEKRLADAGVDVSSSSIQRLEKRICFVAGKPPRKDAPTSSFWVDKDSLFPVRYTVKQENRFVDIRYKDWRKVSRTWYPMRIETFLDRELFSVIDVASFSLEAVFEQSLFDIDRMLQQAEKRITD
ncbi:MAG: hypothetical protein R6V41_03175 [Desulfobacteraceae bacterium]